MKNSLSYKIKTGTQLNFFFQSELTYVNSTMDQEAQ